MSKPDIDSAARSEGGRKPGRSVIVLPSGMDRWIEISESGELGVSRALPEETYNFRFLDDKFQTDSPV